MNILFAGGGTAGHINPALAIANYIKARHPEANIAFIGTREGIEARIVGEAGYRIFFIEVQGFKRKLSLYNVKSFKNMISSISKADKILGEFAPDVVIGTGGYVSGPVLWAATKRKIPTLIHEQNAIPGATTKLLSKRVDRILLSFEESLALFGQKEKLRLTGNPIREEMLFCKKEDARAKLGLDSRPFILSFGGSLGARKINENMIDFLALHSKEGNYQHTHATGYYGWRWVPDLLRDKGVDLKKCPQIKVLEYISDMPLQMAAADLVICRGGAITLSELSAMGRPSILIPSPNVANNHQYHNAVAMQQKGAAVLLEERELTGELLKQKSDSLLGDPERLEKMSKAAFDSAFLSATDTIYQNVMELLKAT